MTINDFTESLYLISKLNYKKYGKKSVILIDEYDAPLINSYAHGFEDKMITIFRNLFSRALKANEYLEMVVLTGILRVSTVFTSSPLTVITAIKNLIVSGSILVKISELSTLKLLKENKNIDDIWSLLFFSGYLTLDKSGEFDHISNKYSLIIPNK